jgi:hypothetical protein
MGAKLPCEIAFERVDGTPDDLAGQTEKRCGILTGLYNDTVGFADQEQATVRLYGSREVDLLALAIC